MSGRQPVSQDWPTIDRPSCSEGLTLRAVRGSGTGSAGEPHLCQVIRDLEDADVSVASVNRLASQPRESRSGVHDQNFRRLRSPTNAVRRRAFVRAGCLVAVMVSSSACSNNASTSRSSSDAAIIATWKAALNAFDNAAHNDDWRSPALKATFASPQLEIVQQNLRNSRLNGEIAVGDEYVISAVLVDSPSSEAMLVACVQDDEVVIDQATRQPVLGVLGESGPERFAATLVKHGGSWKVRSQTVTPEECGAR